ncbi:MAG: SMP-30/gluconolactonase/LRE family protein [Microcella sp.]|uniref:SMP-30/gluconolactonase/LRE family protein n=1 Tax=Microcella sp. TaxID=1913979 RepID=UPI0033160496
MVSVTTKWSRGGPAKVAGEPIVIGEQFGFTEGPVWRADRSHWVFSDIFGSTLWVWAPGGEPAPHRTPSNKANGNALDGEGRLISCEHATSRVVRERDGDTEVIASSFEGRRLNSPNDVIVASSGVIMFTDPTYGLTPDFGVERPQELDFQGVFVLTGSALELLDGDYSAPNGLCLSPDERTLYVNDSARGIIYRYAITADGFGTREQFATPPDTETAVLDGMKCDQHGNVWVTGAGGLWVYAPDGTELGTLEFDGPDIANFAFGGADGDTLMLTARHTVVVVPLTDRLALTGALG